MKKRYKIIETYIQPNEEYKTYYYIEGEGGERYTIERNRNRVEMVEGRIDRYGEEDIGFSGEIEVEYEEIDGKYYDVKEVIVYDRNNKEVIYKN